MVCDCLYVDISHEISDSQATIHRSREVSKEIGSIEDAWISLARENRIDFMGGLKEVEYRRRRNQALKKGGMEGEWRERWLELGNI